MPVRGKLAAVFFREAKSFPFAEKTVRNRVEI